MKKFKTLLILFVILSIYSCNNYDTNNRNYAIRRTTYTDISVKEINNLKAPVILIGKSKNLNLYNVLLKDANDSILYIGNMSLVANIIGESYKIGDTIK